MENRNQPQDFRGLVFGRVPTRSGYSAKGAIALINQKNRLAASLFAGLIITPALLVTTALAKPPAKKKPAGTAKAAIAAGKKVYGANGCVNCHKIGEAGGATGPNLTKVAANPKHTAKWLEVSIVNPKAHNPDSSMPSYDESIKGKDLSNLVAYLSSLK